MIGYLTKNPGTDGPELLVSCDAIDFPVAIRIP